jgi:hypothetical protein
MTKPRGTSWRDAGTLAVTMGFAGVMLAWWLAISSPGALARTDTDTAHDAGYAPAHAARTMRATDKADLSYVRRRSKGSHLYEEGKAYGTLPGSVIARCDLGPPFTASVTILTSAGEIRGRGTATPHASGLYESFAGTLTITGGTGRYAHAHGRAGLYGVFDRRTYDIKVETTGSISLSY